MKKTKGHRIAPNFTEETVGFALESYLSLVSFPRQRFSIEPFSQSDERWLGADARLTSSIRGFRPFYMQFKRPYAYPDFSTSKIIKGRKKLGLKVDPHALYFDLREKQKHHTDFQHNVLFRLRTWLHSTGLGDAAYVCPLFVERSNYRYSMHRSGIWRWFRHRGFSPWELEDVLLNDSGGTINFQSIPILSEHVSIPPHQPVTTAKHSYSFTEEGKNLCFHSPEALPEANSLATFLAQITTSFLGGAAEKINQDQASERLRELISATFSASEFVALSQQIATPSNPIRHWFTFGDYLSSAYGIEQYAIVNWDGFPPRSLY